MQEHVRIPVDMRTESRRKRRSASPDASRNTVEPSQVTGPETPSASEPLASVVAEPATPAVERLAVTLRADGTIETESMRSGTRDKLKKALSDGSLAARLGLSSSPVAGGDAAFFVPEVCGILYDSISKLMIAFAVRAGFPAQNAIDVLPFTPEEKAALAPITGKVLDKWLPIGGKYQDEALLGMMLFGIVNGKLALLRKPADVIPIREVPKQPAPAPGDAS